MPLATHFKPPHRPHLVALKERTRAPLMQRLHR
jgi:hypothetical protein